MSESRGHKVASSGIRLTLFSLVRRSRPFARRNRMGINVIHAHKGAKESMAETTSEETTEEAATAPTVIDEAAKE